MRELLLFIHRWLGLTAGVIFAIASLTGGILVYEAELDRLIAGPRFHTTPGTLEPAALHAAVAEHRPGARILRVDWPTPASNIFRVNIDAGEERENLILDAGSGQILQPRQNHILLRAIRRLHVNLFVGRVGGMIVTYTSLIALLTFVLGVYLWWPGIRKFWKGFQIRLRRDFYILNFDLHQVLGLLALPLLFVMTATGVLFSFPQVTDKITVLAHGSVWVENEWSRLRSRPTDSLTARAEPPALDSVALIAFATAGGGRIERVSYPAGADGFIDVAVHDAPGTQPGDTTRIAIDRNTREVLASRVGSPRFRFDRAMNDRLHLANVGGPITRALYALSCFVGFILLPTGIVVWWIKRGRKAESAERRANAAEART
jgi:uncharacterized iron-regulated membrane protein